MEDSPACQELLSICATLNIPEPRGLDTAGVFSQVHDRVGLKLQVLFCQSTLLHHFGVMF